MISAAAAETWHAEEARRRDALRRLRARRRLETVDALLEVLERMNLERNRVVDRVLRARVRRVEREVGLPLPRRVVRARTPVRLHGALLDWQDTILDQVSPVRRSLLDLDELEDRRDQAG